MEDSKRDSLSKAIAQSSLFQHFKEIVNQFLATLDTETN